MPHIQTREMRDRDKIWTVGSMEISIIDQMKFINSRSTFLAQPMVTTGGHEKGRS
jgi:hypothetical protein